jgi:hypothetical protein
MPREVDFSIDSNVKGSYNAVLSYARLSDVLRESSRPATRNGLQAFDADGLEHPKASVQVHDEAPPRPAKREETGES